MNTLPLPVVGVSVIVFRDRTATEILLVERGREPLLGHWAPPGGRVEAGETIVAAAAREVREECSIAIDLPADAPFTTLDRIAAADGALQYHFVLVGVAAVAEAGAVPVAGDDAAACAWVAISELAALEPRVDDLEWVIGLARERLHL